MKLIDKVLEIKQNFKRYKEYSKEKILDELCPAHFYLEGSLCNCMFYDKSSPCEKCWNQEEDVKNIINY